MGQRWQAKYDASTIGRRHYKIQPQINKKPYVQSNEREVDVAISRLRLDAKNTATNYANISMKMQICINFDKRKYFNSVIACLFYDILNM